MLNQNRVCGGNTELIVQVPVLLASLFVRLLFSVPCSVFRIKICAQLCRIIILGQNRKDESWSLMNVVLSSFMLFF